MDRNKLPHKNENKISSPSPLHASDHALATTIGGKPSGGRPRFLPVPPPAEPGAPLAAGAAPPALAPGAPFFFGVCCCSGAGAIVGIAMPVMCGADRTTDADTGAGVDASCGLSTGVVAGWTTPPPPPIDPGGAPITTGDDPAACALPASAPVRARCTAAAAAVGSFGLAFFFEPDAAAAIAALVGRITCPSGPSFVWVGFGGSSGRTTGATPLALVLASRRS